MVASSLDTSSPNRLQGACSERSTGPGEPPWSCSRARLGSRWPATSRTARLDRSFGRNGIALDPRSNFYLEGHLASGPGGTIVASSSEAITRFTADGEDRQVGYRERGRDPAPTVRARISAWPPTSFSETGRRSSSAQASPPTRHWGSSPRATAQRSDRPALRKGRRRSPRVERLRTGRRGRDAGKPAARPQPRRRRRRTLSDATDSRRQGRPKLGSDGLAAARRIKGRPVDMVQQPDGRSSSPPRATSSSGSDRKKGLRPELRHPRRGRRSGAGDDAPLPHTGPRLGPDRGRCHRGRWAPGSTALAVERLDFLGIVDPTFGSGTGYVARSLGPGAAGRSPRRRRASQRKVVPGRSGGSLQTRSVRRQDRPCRPLTHRYSPPPTSATKVSSATTRPPR